MKSKFAMRFLNFFLGSKGEENIYSEPTDLDIIQNYRIQSEITEGTSDDSQSSQDSRADLSGPNEKSTPDLITSSHHISEEPSENTEPYQNRWDMKPKDKERLVRCRPTLLRALDVDSLLPLLVKHKIYSSKEQREISGDVRRTHRTIQFLDLMEKKKTEVYVKFLDILANFDPHLYLLLTDDEFEGNPQDMHESLRDAESRLERCRDYLCDEIDAGEVLPHFKQDGLLSEQEKHTVMRQTERKVRTEALIDILETKGDGAFDALIEALSDTYPHVYLALTGQDDLDDDDDDWYN